VAIDQSISLQQDSSTSLILGASDSDGDGYQDSHLFRKTKKADN